MYSLLNNKDTSLYYTFCKPVTIHSHKGGDSLKLGNNLKRCRFDHHDMSQDALAKAVGVTRQTILSIEKGKFVPSTLLALKLAKFFNKSVEEIFYLIEEGENEGQ